MLQVFDRVSPQVLRIGALLAVILLILAFFGTQIDNYYEPRLFTRISTSVAIMADRRWEALESSPATSICRRARRGVHRLHHRRSGYR